MRSRVLLIVAGGMWLLAVGCLPHESKPPKPAPGHKAEQIEKNTCVTCHEKRQITGSAVRDWLTSPHARQGVSCDSCHIPPAGAPRSITDSRSTCEDQRVRRSVSSRSCAECHEKQVKQFAAGKHSKAWIAMQAMPTTKDQPEQIREGLKGCGGCHRIGQDEGKCDSCHTRHRFVAAEARRPQACATCHMGFDHAQWEMYSTSKHGIIYALEGNSWDWSKKLDQLYGRNARPEVAARAPVCASCHMPGGEHAVRTAWGFLAVRLPEEDKEWMGFRATILRGLGVLDAGGQPTERLEVVKAGDVARLTAESWTRERQRMLDVCQGCHSGAVARAELQKGDELIKASDKLMAEAVELVEGLWRDGLLDRPKEYPVHVDLLRFYEAPTEIEQKLWVMFLEHRMRNFQGAFHMNPDYQHWYGWAEMKRDLVEIRREAKRLRAEAKPVAAAQPKKAAPRAAPKASSKPPASP